MQFLQYALVGAMATAVHYVLLLMLVEGASWPPALAAGLGALAGAVVAYLANRRFTFSDRAAAHRQAAWRFAVVAVMGALTNSVIVGLATRLACHYLIAQMAATATVMGMTFRLNKTWSFT